MRKVVNCIIVFGIACGIGSCSDNSAVKMAKEFCEALQMQDKEAVEQMYPGVAKADSLVFPGGELLFNMTTVDENKVVNLTNDCYIVLEKDDEGEMKIVDSKGLFYYSPERLDFGNKTGWVTSGMTDLEIAERFCDSGFIEFLVGGFKNGLRVKSIIQNEDGLAADYFWITTIENNTGMDIDGSDYTVTTESEHFAGEFHPSTIGTVVGESGETFPGVDIKDGTTKQFRYASLDEEGKANSTINFVLSNSEILSKYYRPKGTEYEEYRNSLGL